MRIRLLGTLEAATASGEPIGFAFHKVEALLAYLVAEAGRSIERDHLAGLLWPESSTEAARRNFRQALFELRRSLEPVFAEEAVTADRRHVTFSGPRDGVDLLAFRHAVRGLSQPSVGHPSEIEPLERAIGLYRGPFLSDFALDDAVEFEIWMRETRDEIEGQMTELRRRLLDAYRTYGRHHEAVAVARRIVEARPLSETAHRELMELLVLTGDRSQALAQFDAMNELFERELGTSPTQATRKFRSSIQARDSGAILVPDTLTDDRPNPHLPLVGRDDALTTLTHGLRRAGTGEPRLTIVAGPSGIGKSRLVRTFLHHASSRRDNPILLAPCSRADPVPPGGVLVEALHSAPGDPLDVPPKPDVDDILAATEQLRRSSSHRATPILFVDDLHWAGGEDLTRFLDLWNRPEGDPLFLVAAVDPAQIGVDHPLAEVLADDWIDRLDLAPIEEAETAEAVEALVEAAEAERLGSYLHEHSGGDPFRITNLVNTLCDEEMLVPIDSETWTVDWNRVGDGFDAERDSDELIHARISRLPSSARRLLSMAAVVGCRFDIGHLQRLADEDPGVVELCIGRLLRRWILRRSPTQWSPNPPRRDTILWAAGSRLGQFAFSHDRIWEAVYERLPPARRREIHGQIVDSIPRLGLPNEIEEEFVAHHRRRVEQS